VVVNRGNLDAAVAQGSKSFDVTFHWPFQLHGMVGPVMRGGRRARRPSHDWSGTQGSFSTRERVAKLLESRRECPRDLCEGPGSYGRLQNDDRRGTPR